MDNLGLLVDGFGAVLTPQNLLFAAIGVLLGTFVGVLPGIGPAMAVALPVPGDVRGLPAGTQFTADAISAAAPTSATTMNPTNAGVIPNVVAASCTDSTKTSLTNATSTVTPASVTRATPIGMGVPSSPPCSALAKSSGWVLSAKRVLSA